MNAQKTTALGERFGFPILLALMVGMFLVQSLLDPSSRLLRVFYAAIPLGSALIVLGNRRILIGVTALAVIAAGLRMLRVEGTEVIGLYFSVGAYLFATGVCLRRVLTYRRVGVATICGALCVYLLLGLLWTLVYILAAQQDPEAFRGLTAGDQGAELFYFSFVTLTTLGYGDISPASRVAQNLAIVEALMGQLYVLTIIAQLVGLRVAQMPEPPS